MSNAQQTTAEKIAAQFGDDGTTWKDKDGQKFSEVCEAAAIDIDRNQARESVRYTFSDGSVLTATGSGWDIGYPDCYCWEGAGHDDMHCEVHGELALREQEGADAFAEAIDE